MGHYNQIVFSELNTKSIKDISNKIENIFKQFSIQFTVYEHPMHAKVQKKYWDLVWKYDEGKFFGELICYIGIRDRKYHLIIGDTSTFRINRSQETFEKFSDLCQKICEEFNIKYAIYCEEPTTSELFVSSHLNRALYILEMHNNYKTKGLVIIYKNEIEEIKAKEIIPSNAKLSLTNSGFYIYKMH